MAIRRSPWLVPYQATNTEYSFFISYVQDDAKDVKRLKQELEKKSAKRNDPLQCFLDIDDWPLGRVSMEVIREYLLRSQFMVAWITPSYLQNTRGWNWMELASASLIELSMNRDRLVTLAPFVIPIFRGVSVSDVERTPWLEFWQQKIVQPNQRTSIPKLAELLISLRQEESKRRIALGL